MSLKKISENQEKAPAFTNYGQLWLLITQSVQPNFETVPLN